VVNVYDGDTFRVNLQCDYDVLCNNLPVRVSGIDTPEIKTKDGCEKRAAKKAKAFTQTFLKGKNIELKNCKRDKYFRLLCDVFADGKNLAEEILNAGLAVPYDGGTKQKTDWCKQTK
jgi:endonuclease YncB( thermonuclease family)